MIQPLLKWKNINNDSELQKLLSLDNQLNDYFKLIPDNYDNIIQQISQNNEDINKNKI